MFKCGILLFNVVNITQPLIDHMTFIWQIIADCLYFYFHHVRYLKIILTLCLGCSGPVARVLLFNATGERDSAAMLKLLVVSTYRHYTTFNC